MNSPVIGILLAAGRSRRMGRAKQLLPWPPGTFGTEPSTTVAASAFDAIAPWCGRMIVVLGHEADAVIAALGDRPFTRVQADPDAPMLESIKAGLRCALALQPFVAAILHPCDHPMVRAETMNRLVDQHRADPWRAAMPEHQGKGGHPVIVPLSMVSAILEFNREGGLRRFWVDHPELCLRVPVDDETAIVDLDTPAQYHAVRGIDALSSPNPDGKATI